ncbi:predicted protein [Naegleria gruberi]|uniref:Predicted protein n=1 Tax=Naegleria gruberi TaxID=5762 RepID=D2VIQ7_NAEGR|nr:uncharacterized protein NAEGRDRAFT_80111 [Naegleria gruberi]EFC43392.1 predicted protein [Naegleria gruberi]|eukprot:XP_002676136.1 predicted protein [Naegleria gruberi strain NEG-M]
MDNYETLLSGGDEDFDFTSLLGEDEQQTTSDIQQQQQPTVVDVNAFYGMPSDMGTFDFYNPMSADNQNPSVTFPTTTGPIIPVMFNNNYPAVLQNAMHPSMFSNAFFGAFNTSPTQFMTGSVSSNSLSPTGGQTTTTDQSSTSGQSSGTTATKKKAPARKKKKVSSDSKTSKQTSSGSESDEEKARKKSNANNARKRDAEEIDADMKRLLALENAEDLTEQQKEEKKKLRNRYTAKVSRDRKKKELETLRDENHGLQKKLDEAQVTIKSLKEQNEKLVHENHYLQSQLAVVYSSYTMSTTDNSNPDNRKRNTIMRSAVIILGILFVFTIFTFLTGSFNYNSSSKTSFTSSSQSPQSEQKTARRLARGLLSINGSNYEQAPNYVSRTTPRNVESVGSKSLPTHATSSHSVNQNLPEPIYVENTMEMGESLEEDFNPDGMMSYDVFYPSKLKRHFSSFSYQNPKQNASEASHIRNYDNSTSASPIPNKKKSVTSQRHNNSKQISVLTRPTMLSKRIEEKKHKYERATVYVPSEHNIPSDKPDLHMFCPYLYPLVAGVPDTGYEFSTKDFEASKKSSMKIHIPIQMVCNKTNTKVIRMAEINAENITLTDVFYEFNGPSLPPRSVVTD